MTAHLKTRNRQREARLAAIKSSTLTTGAKISNHIRAAHTAATMNTNQRIVAETPSLRQLYEFLARPLP